MDPVFMCGVQKNLLGRNIFKTKAKKKEDLVAIYKPKIKLSNINQKVVSLCLELRGLISIYYEKFGMRII